MAEKSLTFVFISIVVTCTWAAVWFFSIVNPDFVYPSSLNIAFLAVAAASGIVVYQNDQALKKKVIKDLQARLAAKDKEIEFLNQKASQRPQNGQGGKDAI